MKNKFNFYTKLISTILDSCCSYIVTVENSDIKLISTYGNKPFDLHTLKLLLNNFDPIKKSFSVIEVKDFKNTITNDNFSSKNLKSIGYSPILDENKITIGYFIISFNKSSSFSKSQEKTISLISSKISEKLRKSKSTATKDLKSSESTDFKLNLTKEILKKTFKFTNDVFCIINKDQKFEFVSNSSLNVWGYTPEEMIGTHFKNYIVEEDILESLETEHQAKNNAEISLFENRYIHRNRSIKSMLWSANWDQESELLYCIAKDVTDYKKLIIKNDENENLLLEAQRLARMGSWNFNFKDDKLTWSDGLYNVFDVDKELFLENHSSFIDFIVPEDRDFVVQTSKNTQETGESFNIVYRIKTPSGAQRFVEEFGYVEKDATGKIKRFFGTAQDITERKKNELLLQDSNKKYKYLFDNNPLPLYIFDFETLKITDCNFESLILYGYSREEFLQLTLKDIRPEEDIALILESTKSESTYGEIHKKVWRHLKKNGKLMYVEITAHLLDYNNTRSSLVLVNDITEKKELEKLFKKTNELAQIGGWEVDLQNNTILWSDITKEIHEVTPDYIPDLETAIAFYKKGSNRTRITEYVQQAINTGKPWDDEFQIVTAKGNERWVRAIGEAEFVNGNCGRIYGSFQDIHERKITEQQKNTLLTTLEKSLNEIYVFDAETLKFSYVNQGALLNNGYSEQEIKQLTPLDLAPEFTVTKFNKLINPLVTKKKEKIIFFTNHKRKNGSLYPVEIHLQFVAEGSNKRFLAVILDITERKRAEKEIIEYKSALDQSSIVAITNQKGIIQHVNENFCKISKYKSDELIGQDHRIINSGYHTKSFIKNIWVTIANGKIWRGEMCNKAKNGSIYWVDTTIVPLFDEHGKPNQYIAIRADITQRKKAEEKFSKAADALQKALNDNNKIMDSSLDLICVVDKEGYFVKVSAASEAILGYKPEELIGKPIINYVYNKDNEKTQITADFVMSGKSIKHFENRYIRKDGSLVPMEWTARWDEKDKLRFGVARDITERKTHEDQLLKLNNDLNKQKAELITSNTELEQFAYIASHDLQEPLRMVTSFLTLLEKRYNHVLDEKGLNYINFAVVGAKNMRQIILDILEFSRINNNEEKYELIDLKDIIKDVSLLQGKLIKEKKATIIFEKLPELYSIRHYLVQIFQNIISNALKYSKEEVPLQIKIKSKEYKNHYQIALTDNGIGIEKEYYEQIFIIFRRLHGKEKYEGNGMGLAIAKKIVNKLNGTIWVKSRTGIGSTFYINIPKK